MNHLRLYIAFLSAIAALYVALEMFPGSSSEAQSLRRSAYWSPEVTAEDIDRLLAFLKSAPAGSHYFDRLARPCDVPISLQDARPVLLDYRGMPRGEIVEKVRQVSGWESSRRGLLVGLPVLVL
jgi:hypothetical protein